MTPIHQLMCFLLSVHAVCHALIAIESDPAVALSALAVLLATFLGTVLFPKLAEFVDPRFRFRSLAAVVTVYFVVVAMLFSTAVDGNLGAMATSLHALILYQLGFVVFAGAGRGYLGVHHNSLALICATILAGGWVAATAIVGYVGLTVFWLVIDQFLRGRAPLAKAWRPAFFFAGSSAGIVAAVLVILPPQAYEPVARNLPSQSGSLTPALGMSYLKMALALVIGVVVLYLLRRFLLEPDDEEAEAITEEFVDVRRGRIGEGRPPLPRERIDTSGWRGEVLRLYKRFLHRLSKRGVRRRPDWTPRELAARLPAPAGTLAEVFGRARYDDEELTEADFDAAKAASSATLDAIES